MGVLDDLRNMRSESTKHEQTMRHMPSETSFWEWLLYPKDVEHRDRGRASVLKELEQYSSDPKDPTKY